MSLWLDYKHEGLQILPEALRGWDDKAALLDLLNSTAPDLSHSAAWEKGQSRRRVALFYFTLS